MALEAQRRGWWLGWAGPVAFAAAAAVAVFFATVGALAGFVGGSGLHSVTGIYAGIAAGVVFFGLGLVRHLPRFPGMELLVLLLCVAAPLGASATFAALFARVDRVEGRVKKAVRAAIFWPMRFAVWTLVFFIPFFFSVYVGRSIGYASMTMALVGYVGALYAAHRSTRMFFMELRRGYDPMVEALRIVRERQGRTGPADAVEPEETEASSAEAETQKGDTDEDDH